MLLWNNKNRKGKNMNQIMNVEFLNGEDIKIEYNGKTSTDSKKKVLESFRNDIFKKDYIVGNNIERQDVGDFIYYQFYYFDGTSSRKIRFQIPKTDLNSVHFVDQVLSEIEEKKGNDFSGIIFEDEEN